MTTWRAREGLFRLACESDLEGIVAKRKSDPYLLEVSRIFNQVEKEFGSLDIFVSNARTEAPTFYEPPMDITLDKWSG